MTESREYQESDKFKRFLLRQIRAGKNLAARGWEGDMMPLDLHTLQVVKDRYDEFKSEGVSTGGRPCQRM